MKNGYYIIAIITMNKCYSSTLIINLISNYINFIKKFLINYFFNDKCPLMIHKAQYHFLLMANFTLLVKSSTICNY